MVVFPNAKINLGLDILRRRDDGYHDISTLFIPVAWRDILEIVPSKSATTQLHQSGNKVDCPPEKNLVMKAYRLLDQAVELPPLDIYLHKNIPDGAGLGGGSADAAFTLTAINSMLALGLSQEELAGMAAEIGADCPFFIYNRPMLASDTGTTLTPIDITLPHAKIVIVKPEESVNTREAYSAVTPRIPAIDLRDRLLTTTPDKWRDCIVNDFEQSVFPHHPRIAEIKQALYDGGAFYAAMSGSGSAVFALFDDDKLAEAASQTFADCKTHISSLTE